MLKLRNKLNKKGGFTLVEMLIVVAIIAILIAVSIPLITGALERTRMATDAANERAAKAEANILYLSNELDAGGVGSFTVGDVYVYDAANGKLIAADATGADSINPYGKCTTNGHGSEVIYLSINKDGEISMGWDEVGKDAVPTTDTLCGDTINK